jgi:membrane-associated phospholipid phosphatase
MLDIVYSIDTSIATSVALLHAHYPGIAPLFKWISMLGGVEFISGASLFLVIFLIVHKKFRLAVEVGSALVLTGAVLTILKFAFMRSRPEYQLVDTLSDPSFPSAHAGMAAAFFAILGYVLFRSVKSTTLRWCIACGCVIVAGAIGVSRVILNVHWASDVVAGWVIGICFATISVYLLRYAGTRRRVINRNNES